MKLHVKHTTDYRYSEPLLYALQTLWLTPQSGPAQTVDFWSLGAPEKLFPQHDAYGNSIHSHTFVGKVSDDVRWSLVNAAGQVDTLGVAEFVDAPSLPHPSFFLRPTHLAARMRCSRNSAGALFHPLYPPPLMAGLIWPACWL